MTLFGSAFPREGTAEYDLASEMGRMLGGAGYVVCNGGYGGTMEASARGAKEAGGATIGVLTETFGSDPNRYIDRKIVLKSPVDRLLKLIELGDAYVVLRGGTGTLVELASTWEYMNKGILREKPIVAVGNFWTTVVETVRGELLREGNRRASLFMRIVSTPAECLEVLKKSLGNPKTAGV